MGDLEEEGVSFKPNKQQENYFYKINDPEFLKDIIFEVKFNLELTISEFLSNCNFEEIPDVNNYEKIGEEWNILDKLFDNFCEDNFSSIQAIEKYYSNKPLIDLIKARRAYYHCIHHILNGTSEYYKNFVEKIKNKNYKEINKENYSLIKQARYYYKINKDLDLISSLFKNDTDWFEEDEWFFNK